MKTAALALVSLFAIPVAHAAYDRYGNYYGPTYRSYDSDSRPVYTAQSREECWNTRTRRFENRPESSSRVGAGTAIGAVAGGVIGHQVGSGRGNDAATVGGALLGGLLGHQIEKDRRDDNPDFDMTRCRTVASNAPYDSTYSYVHPYDNNWR
jgi:uncharacterized protein YcfJ